MAIKKKAILTDNTTLPTTPTVIPTLPPVPPLLTNIIALPFGLAYKLPTQNVRNIPVLPDSTLTRPSQNVGFDITITDLTQPKPMYLNDINGIFNLYSGTLADICSGLVPQFDPRYIAIRQQLNAQPAPPSPTPTPTPLIAGYRAGAILFSPTNLAWYLSLQDDNQDNTINSLTPTPSAWQKITDVSSNLVQQGRLNGSQGNPYNDTSPTGNPTLYFTPTEQGNLIALYNGNNWVTQAFTELSLPVSSLVDLSASPAGGLVSIGTADALISPTGIAISPDNLNVYVCNSGSINVSQYGRNSDGTLYKLTPPTVSAGQGVNRIIVSPNGLNVYVTNYSDTNIVGYNRDTGTGLLTYGAGLPTGQNPQGVAITPDGNYVYVANINSNSITFFNSSLQSNLGYVGTGANPQELIVSPDNRHVYVTINNGSYIARHNIQSNGTLTAIIDTFPTGNAPRGIAITSDGNYIYVACNNGGSSGGSITQFSRNSDGSLNNIGYVGNLYSPLYVTISPDGKNVYATNGGGGLIYEFNRSTTDGTLSTLGSVGGGTSPQGIVIDSTGNTVYVANTGNGSSNSVVSEYSRTPATIPTVSLTQPNRTSNVPINTTITLTFSEAVSGVSLSTIKLQIGSQTSIATSISVNGNSYTINYTPPLTGVTQYSVIVKSGITSVAAGIAVAQTQFNFTTVDTNVPTVSLTSPNPITNVSLTPTIQLTFSEAVRNVTTTTINFEVQNGTPINITITNSGNNVYTINLPTSLLIATNYSVVINTGITSDTAGRVALQPITFGFSTTFPSPNLHDIFVGNNTSNVLTLAYDQFSNGTGTGTNRQQLANGKWVNAHTITTVTPNIPANQGLLVGSIAVLSGVVQSWNGYRGIFNLYNQVALGLLAYQTSALTTPYKWQNNSLPTYFRNQNANSIAGTGNFYFLIDLLYNQDFTCEYNGGGYFTAVGDNGIVGIALNPITNPPTPLVTFSYGGLSGSAGIVPFNLSYGYQFNNVSTTQLPIGLNLLQKVESGVGYFSDNIGLTAIYYG